MKQRDIATAGYGTRALVEVAIGRYKGTIGPRLVSCSADGSRYRMRRPQSYACLCTPEIRAAQGTDRINIILKELNPSWLGSMHQRLYQVELTDQLLKLKFIPSGDEVISTPY